MTAITRTSLAISTALIFLAMAACSSAPTAEDEAPAEDEMVHEEESHHHDHHDDHHGHDHHEGHDHHAGHHDHRFEDPEQYAERWNDPARDEWQQPEAIIEAMEIEEGMTVADLGAGTGYFVPFLAQAVGDEGRVLAADIEESMLQYIDDMAEEQGLENVETVKAEFTHSGLPEGEVDRIVTVNTWHHIADRGEYSEHLYQTLSDDGSVWVVDFHEDSPMGPPPEHRLPPEVVIAELEEGGFEAELHELRLERQYIVVGHRR